MMDIMTQDVLIGAIADFPDGEIRPAFLPDGTPLAVSNVEGGSGVTWVMRSAAASA